MKRTSPLPYDISIDMFARSAETSYRHAYLNGSNNPEANVYNPVRAIAVIYGKSETKVYSYWSMVRKIVRKEQWEKVK
jgi:hypothetical protein